MLLPDRKYVLFENEEIIQNKHGQYNEEKMQNYHKQYNDFVVAKLIYGCVRPSVTTVIFVCLISIK